MTHLGSRAARWALVLPGFAGLAALALSARMILDRERFAGAASLFGHCVAPGLLGLALWALVLLRPALRGRLNLLLVSLGAALVGAEIAIRVLLPLQHPDIFERVRRASAAGVRFDKRSQFEVANDLRRQGVRAFPMQSAGTVMAVGSDGRWRSEIRLGDREVVPLSGVARARTMLGNESGVHPDFVSDEMGFNNPPGLWDGAPVDVVLLGDSMLLGWGVEPGENLAAPVRARFPRTLNLGVTGAGPLSQLGQIREYGPALRPRIVVLFFYEGNDLRDLNRENASLLARYLDPTFRQGLVERHEHLDRALAAHADRLLALDASLARNIGQVAQLKRLRLLTGFAAPPLDGIGRPSGPLYERVIRASKAACDGLGAKPMLVYLPKWHRFSKPADAPALDVTRRFIMELAAKEGIPALDVTELFQATGDPLDAFPYRLQGHYNARGNRLIGEALAARIAALLP